MNDADAAYRDAVDCIRGQLGPAWVVFDWNNRELQWRSLRPAHRVRTTQGWKIHSSASAKEAHEMLRAVAPVLVALQVPFKIARRLENVVFLNSGDAGLASLGKVLTAYLPDETQLSHALERLDAAWPRSRGPEVCTDLHLRPGSAISFRYGVHASGTEIVDSSGTHHDALVAADGTELPDRRSTSGYQPAIAPPVSVPGCLPTPDRLRLNQALRCGGTDYLPLARLSDTPRGQTFLAMDLGTLGTVVMKSARFGVGGDASGEDVCHMLTREHATLTHLALFPGLAPRPLGFLAGDSPVLVMEDVRGEALCELPRAQAIDALLPLARAVARMHVAGVVHGDLKLDNAICMSEEADVRLLDFELSARIGEPMRPGGTPGHLAPEVAGRKIPASPARDVYALAGCVAHAVLQFPPALASGGLHACLALLHNEDAGDVARALARCGADQPLARPDAAWLVAKIERDVTRWRQRVSVPGRPSCDADRRWCWQASAAAADAAMDFVEPQAVGACWRNEHFQRDFACEAINIGTAGILLGLVSVDECHHRRDHDDVVAAGARWLASRPSAGKAAGLFSGNAGVALALAVTARRLGDPRFAKASRDRFAAAAVDVRHLDLFSGAAGVVWTASLLAEIDGEPWALDLVSDTAVPRLLACATQHDGVPTWRNDVDAETLHFGCAHGSAGVALALASWGRATGDAAMTARAREAFRALLRNGRTADGRSMRLATDDERRHAAGNWCHGVAGHLWAILVGLGDDEGLRPEIDWCVDVLSDAMAVGTPTMCHGLAGQLELWRMLTAIDRHRPLALRRAAKVVRALRAMQSRRQGRIVWSSDQADIVTPDLWIGFMGPASQLALYAAGVADPLLSGTWLRASARSGGNRQPESTVSSTRVSADAVD